MTVPSKALRPGRAFLVSAALHASAAATLWGALAGATGKPPPDRVEVGWAEAVVLEEARPAPDERAAPTVREQDVAAGPVLEDGAETFEAADPRLGGESPAEGARAGVLGVGSGFPFRTGRGRLPRLLPVRGAAAAAPAPVPGPAPPTAPTMGARPIAEACPKPGYPAREHRLGVEGVVEVRAEVDASGAVVSVEVAATSGSAALDRAAVGAVLRWRFEPALREGVPVPDSVRLRIRFELLSASLAPKGKEQE